MSPAQKITDLADLCAPPITVPVFGERFRVPGAPPLDWSWTFDALDEKLSKPDADVAEIVEDMRAHLVELFLIHQPDERDRIHEALGKLDARGIVLAVRGIYGGLLADEQEDAPADPPKRAAKQTKGGTRSTSSRSKTGSRTKSRSST